MVPQTRNKLLQWDWLDDGRYHIRVDTTIPGSPTFGLRTAFVHRNPPAPAGLMMPLANQAGQQYPFWPTNDPAFGTQCMDATREALRLRALYILPNPPPGSRGFTGFSLDDLRKIAKMFGDPAIYTILP